jgi:ankyrin repeat protein
LRVSIPLLFFSLLNGCTPLHLSSEKGHLETCRLLLQSKADVMAPDDM